jgi:hypothetical protein
MESGSGTS